MGFGLKTTSVTNDLLTLLVPCGKPRMVAGDTFEKVGTNVASDFNNMISREQVVTFYSPASLVKYCYSLQINLEIWVTV